MAITGGDLVHGRQSGLPGGERYAKITRTSGIRCTCTVTSVITPKPSGTTQA